MADLSALDLFLNGGSVGSDQGLNAFRQTVRSNDYYRAAAAPLLSAKFNTSLMDPGTAFGVTAAQAFLGSALNALGQQSEAKQLISAAQALPSLQRDPLNTAVPEGVDEEAFGALRLSAIKEIFDRRNDTDRYLAIRGIFRKPDGTLGRDPGLQELEQQDMVREVQAERAKALMKVLGEQEGLAALGIDPKTLPDTPQGKQTKAQRELEDTTYKRITDLPQYKLLADVESNFRSLMDLSKQDSKAADIGLISTIARIRDPNSVVREGEYYINSDTQSFLDKIAGNWRATVTGESRLTRPDKARIIASVVPKYNELGQSYLEARNPLIEALKAQGGNPANVPTIEFQPFNEALLYAETPEAVPPGMRLQRNRTTGEVRLVPQ